MIFFCSKPGGAVAVSISDSSWLVSLRRMFIPKARTVVRPHVHPHFESDFWFLSATEVLERFSVGITSSPP